MVDDKKDDEKNNDYVKQKDTQTIYMSDPNAGVGEERSSDDKEQPKNAESSGVLGSGTVRDVKTGMDDQPYAVDPDKAKLYPEKKDSS